MCRNQKYRYYTILYCIWAFLYFISVSKNGVFAFCFIPLSMTGYRPSQVFSINSYLVRPSQHQFYVSLKIVVPSDLSTIPLFSLKSAPIFRASYHLSFVFRYLWPISNFVWLLILRYVNYSCLSLWSLRCIFFPTLSIVLCFSSNYPCFAFQGSECQHNKIYWDFLVHYYEFYFFELAY